MEFFTEQEDLFMILFYRNNINVDHLLIVTVSVFFTSLYPINFVF